MIINESSLIKKLRNSKPYWEASTRLGLVQVHPEYDPDRKDQYFVALQALDSGKIYYWQELTLNHALSIGNQLLGELKKFEKNKDVYGDAVVTQLAKKADMLTFYY